MEEPSRNLSIFLAKGEMTEEDLVDSPALTVVTPVDAGHVPAKLYTQTTPPHLPSWTSFFEDAVDFESLGLQTASASGVLVLTVKNRLFAVTFGHGRSLINPEAVEPTFGLRVTLNSVAPNKIRSIDRRTFEGIGTYTREQATRNGSFGDFGLNVERDLLRAVVGTPEDVKLGTRLAGIDSLTATCKTTLQMLPAQLGRYLAASNKTIYRERYPWIDNIQEVRDKPTRDALDDVLVRRLRQGGRSPVWLAVPEVIDWSGVDGFTFSGAKAAQILDDLRLSDYLEWARALSPNNLRTHRIHAIRAADGYPVGRWSAYQCLYAEVKLARDNYILTNGNWYKVDRDFVSVINDAVNRIPSTTFVPIESASANEDEGSYNIRLADSITGSCCMDKQMIRYGGSRSSIEFCDVYSPSRQLIHVKRYSGSSVLSHLFSQGVVSATAFISDEKFRKAVNGFLPRTLHVPVRRRPTPSEYEVAYFITTTGDSLTLPFFSRVTLRNAQVLLSSYDFRVTLTRVGCTPQRTPPPSRKGRPRAA